MRAKFLFVLILLMADLALSAEPATPRSLRAAATGLFTIGAGIHDRIPERPTDWPLLLDQFSAVTPENCLKPNPVQVSEGKFNFTLADAFVDFAQSNKLLVVGHTLVWAKDDRTPPWFFRDGTNTASRDVLLARMKTHIDTVAGRYRGRMAMWDVVNEALDDGTNFLRPSGWSAACGEDFIAKAFEFAHAADPKALLIYNDYNNELPAKRPKQIRLIRILRERNAPVHAIGLQGHYEIDRVPFADIEAMLDAMRELGIKVVVSELDIDVIPRGKWWADGGKHRDELSKLDPYRDGCPPEILQRQADQYAQLFRLFRKYSDVIARVSFWNLHDGQSWLNDFPWKRVNHPLLFDRNGKPKPAFDAVIEALTSRVADRGPGTSADVGLPLPPYPGCVKIFNGSNFDGWVADSSTWSITNGSMRGIAGTSRLAYTREDYGSFRLIFTARMNPVNRDHLGILFWGDRPADSAKPKIDNAGWIQFMPPHGAMWDYHPPKHRNLPHDTLAPGLRDFTQWTTTELLCNIEKGTMRAAVNGVEIARYRHPFPNERSDPEKRIVPGPIGMFRHGGGASEYKEIHLEANPKEDKLVTVR